MTSVRKLLERRPAWPVLALCLPIVYALYWAGDFVYLRGAVYSDLLISHYPNLLFLRNTLLSDFQVPLWSPGILSGYPFFASPLSALWYPPGWLAVLSPEAWMFNALAVGHLVFGAVGMRRFLGSKGVGTGAAVLGGLGFGLMPKLMAHFGAGHITLVYAVVWTPWLLLAQDQGRSWFRPGVVLGVIFLADPRWAAYAGVLWLAYSFAHSRNSGADAAPGRVFAGKWLRSTGFDAGLSLFIAAPLLLPLIEYTVRSSRSLITSEETLIFSLPAARFIGLMLPIIGGQVEWVLYAGGAIVAGCFAAIFLPLGRPAKFWGAAALLSLLFALGDQVPVLRLWAELPGANLFRVPSRALFIFGFSLCVLFAYGLHSLTKTELKANQRVQFYRLAVVLVGLGLGILAASFFMESTLASAFIHGGLSLSFGGVVIVISIARTFPERSVYMIVGIIMVLDSAAFVHIQLTTRDPAEVFSEGEAAAAWISAQEGQFRVFSPSYSIPQHTAARFGLELSDGVDPLHLQAYAIYMENASGVQRGGYSVTVPAMDGDPESANVIFQPDPALLGRLNVKFIAAAFDLEVEGLVLREQFGTTRIYENIFFKDRVFSFGEIENEREPEIKHWSPNRIEIQCECPGTTIVLSELSYPGWQISGGTWVDAEERLLREMVVEENEKGVELLLRPLSLYVGLGLLVSAFFVVWATGKMENAGGP